MFIKTKTESILDAEIITALAKLDGLDPTDEKYKTIVEQVSKLHKLKAEEHPRMKQISADTILVVAANIFGILWLARYERNNVIKAPNAMKNVLKAR